MRSFRRGFARVRSHHKGLWNTAVAAAGLGALFAQATSGDQANLANVGTYAGGTFIDKLKVLGVCFAERISFGAISNQSVKLSTGQSVVGLSSKPTLNPINILNKFFGAGLFAWGLSKVPGVPMRGKLSRIGKSVMVGAAIGGLLDDPISSALNRGGQLAPAGPLSRSVTQFQTVSQLNSR